MFGRILTKVGRRWPLGANLGGNHGARGGEARPLFVRSGYNVWLPSVNLGRTNSVSVLPNLADVWWRNRASVGPSRPTFAQPRTMLVEMDQRVA